MPDPKLHKDLLEYVKQQRAGGIPDAEIRRALLINHWPIADIDQVLAQKTSQPRGRGLGLLTKIIIGFFVVVFIEAGAYAWSTTQFHAQLASSPFATNTSFVPEALTPITGVDSTENNLQSPPIHSTLPSVGTTYASGGTSQSTNTGTVATQTTSPSLIDVLSEELLALESQLASQTSGSVVTPPIQGQGSNGGGGYEGGDDGGDEGGDGGDGGGGQDYELPTCSVSADPASITDGDSSTLTWSTSNTSSIVITPDIGDSDLSGSQTVSPTNTTVYNLEAIGPGGITNCDATVTVNNTPPPPLPTCTLSAAPTSINLGDATTLTWSTTQATSVSITPDIGTVDDSGSVEDSPTQNTLYTLAATGPGGTANCTAPVTVVTQGGGGNGLTEVVPGASGVLLGIHVWPGGGVPLDESEFSSFEQSIGRPLAIDSEYYNWDELGDSDNTAIVEWDKQNGLLPMISWRPDITKNKDQEKDTCASANQILSGADDAQIKQQADTLKGYGTPILLRWNYEMTDNEFNYCFNNGAKVDPADYATAGPTYVAVWKYIHDIFTAEGATNVSWVWAPAASLFTSGGGLDATDWQYFYPGSSYVDWIANDHYNKTDTPESYATDPEIQNFYTEVAGLGKPLMQSETGAHSDTNQNPDPQTEWLTTMFTAMQTQYPAFRAMVYWDGDSSDTNNDDENQDNNPDDNNDDTNFGLGTNNGNGEDNVAPYTIVGAGLAAYTTFAEETPFNVIAQLSNNNDVQKANLNSNAAPAKTSLLTEVTNFILGTKTTSPSKSVTPATTSKKPTSSTSVQ